MKFRLLGEPVTPQQFDFARDALYQFVSNYRKALEDNMHSVALSFKSSEQYLNFLSSILVFEDQEYWTVEGAKQVRDFFNKSLPDSETMEKVVADFFTLNHKWVGFSPALSGAKSQAMNLIVSRMLTDSPELKKLLKEGLASIDTSFTQGTGT